MSTCATTGPSAALFQFSPDRRGEHPQAHLTNWTGVLQADAYGGYGRLYEGGRKPAPIIEAAARQRARKKVAVIAPTTPVALAPGQRVSFVLSEADRLRFAFTGFVQAVSAADPAKGLVGRFVSYDRPTGTLTVDVTVASGEGEPDDWTIMPSLPPDIPAAVLVAGSGDIATSADTGAHVVPVTNMVTLLQLLLSTPIVEPAGSGVLWRNGDNLLLSSGD